MAGEASGAYLVKLTGDELSVICNALGEVLGGVETWEFSSRLGVDLDEADALRRRLADLLPGITPPQT